MFIKKIVNLGILLLVLIGFSGISFAAPPHQTTRSTYSGDPMNPESVGGGGCNTHTLRYWSIIRYSSSHVKLYYKETDQVWKGNKWMTSTTLTFYGDYKKVGYHKMSVTYNGYLNGKYYATSKTKTTARSAYNQCAAENPYDAFEYIS